MFCEMTEIVMPGDTNNLGTAFGGKIMQWIDVVAAIAAMRFAKGIVVTASIDNLEFKKPIQLGDIVTLKAAVNRSWNTSMEVGVKVTAWNEKVGEVQACRAYLTFVALDGQGRRCEIPSKIVAFLPDDPGRRRFEQAEKRRAARLAARQE